MAEIAPPRSPIVAILNTFAPATGANRSQTIIRANGDVQIFGDEALARVAIGQLVNARLSRAESPMLPEPPPPPKAPRAPSTPQICTRRHRCGSPGAGPCNGFPRN